MSSHPRRQLLKTTVVSSYYSQQPVNMAPQTPVRRPTLLFLPQSPKADYPGMLPFASFDQHPKSLRDMRRFMAHSSNDEPFQRSQNRRHSELSFYGFPPWGKLPGEENAKVNVNPEAYCDICKKEFCSKYFLRTHKQNIHDIKCDLLTSSVSREEDGLCRQTYNMTTRNIATVTSYGKPNEKMEKGSWRCKKPMNASRVTCDVCNKEVCNKYFLRTHKLKMHGIATGTNVPTPSPSLSVHGSAIAFASDCGRPSESSSQLYEKTEGLDCLSSVPKGIPLPLYHAASGKFYMEYFNHLKVGEMHHIPVPLMNNNNKSSSSSSCKNNNDNVNNENDCLETCFVCKQIFKNARLLTEHIWKHHSMKDTTALTARTPPPPMYPCQICGIDFQTDLSVQLHLILEHKGRVTLEKPRIPTKESTLPNGEEKQGNSEFISRHRSLHKSTKHPYRTRKYVCHWCKFSSVWLSSLIDHEHEVHGFHTYPYTPSYGCHQCHKPEPSVRSLSAHLKKAHGWTTQDVDRDVRSRRPLRSNGYKCSRCLSVFPSKIGAMRHFRQIHIRDLRDARLKTSYQQDPVRCRACLFKTHFVSKLNQHVKLHILGNRWRK